MRVNFGELFQEKSKDKTMNGIIHIPIDETLWPPSWTTVEYKEYARFKKILLPVPNNLKVIGKDFSKRRSEKSFTYKKNNEGSVTLEQLSNILYYSCGETYKSINGSTNKRAQASAGARYPLEIYVLPFHENILKKKCYHYNIKNHALEELWDIQLTKELDVNRLFGYSLAKNAWGAIIVTAIPFRTTIKYGERGYKYIYLEAGAVLQNLQNHTFIENIKSTIMGGVNEQEVEELLDLDGVSETVILGIIFGK